MASAFLPCRASALKYSGCTFATAVQSSTIQRPSLRSARAIPRLPYSGGTGHFPLQRQIPPQAAPCSTAVFTKPGTAFVCASCVTIFISKAGGATRSIALGCRRPERLAPWGAFGVELCCYQAPNSSPDQREHAAHRHGLSIHGLGLLRFIPRCILLQDTYEMAACRRNGDLVAQHDVSRRDFAAIDPFVRIIVGAKRPAPYRMLCSFRLASICSMQRLADGESATLRQLRHRLLRDTRARHPRSSPPLLPRTTRGLCPPWSLSCETIALRAAYLLTGAPRALGAEC